MAKPLWPASILVICTHQSLHPSDQSGLINRPVTLLTRGEVSGRTIIVGGEAAFGQHHQGPRRFQLQPLVPKRQGYSVLRRSSNDASPHPVSQSQQHTPLLRLGWPALIDGTLVPSPVTV